MTDAPAPWRNRIVGSGEEDPTRLMPNERNWRTHPEAQGVALATVLDRVGYVQQVLVNRRSGRMVDGHLRVKLALQHNEALVPVLYVDLDPEEEALILSSLDPLSAMAGTDRQVLADLLASVQASDSAMLQLLEDIARQYKINPVAPAEGEAAEAAEPLAQAGDLWILGNHRLVCGDATNAGDVALAIGTARPLLMVTDPPYGVNYDPEWRGNERLNATVGPRLGKVTNDDSCDWTAAYALFPGDVAYVWSCALQGHRVALQLEGLGWDLRCQIIWDKGALIISRGNYHWQHEPCWYAVRKGRTAHWRGDRTQSSVWAVPKLGASDEQRTNHSTQKPLELMRRPLRNNTKPGDWVYDPFLGSGTTLIAAEELGRRCAGLEIEPAYADMIIARWKAATGGEPILEQRQ